MNERKETLIQILAERPDLVETALALVIELLQNPAAAPSDSQTSE